MNVLNSAWLVRMLSKAGTNPRQRLLAVFDILDDWIDAPHIRQQLQSAEADFSQPQILLEYLTAQAIASHVQHPELLAQQLCIMASRMLKEELHAPGCGTSRHAREAAQALIEAQTKNNSMLGKHPAYAIAAGVCTVIISGLLMMPDTNKPANANIDVGLAARALPAAAAPTLLAQSQQANPQKTAAMFASLEQMRSGTCQYPEALMLPESQKSIYIDSVVGGQVPTIAQDQQVFGELLKKVRCNYTPMLMANSTS